MTDRILLAGDTHGNTDHMFKLLDIAAKEGCSRIFQLGDFGAWEHMPDGVQFLDDINRYAQHVGIDIYWLDGNHDKTSLVLEKYGDNRDAEGFLVCRPRVRYAPRGHVWTWKGKVFMALGGAYSVDKGWRLAQEQHDAETQGLPEPTSLRGTLWFPEEEMTDEDLDRYLTAAPPKVNIMLTHDKPRSSSPHWNRKDLLECWPNQDRIQAAVRATAPDLLFHGHLHWRYEDAVEHDRGVTRVIGLSSDPQSSITGRERESWMVLDLND